MYSGRYSYIEILYPTTTMLAGAFATTIWISLGAFVYLATAYLEIIRRIILLLHHYRKQFLLGIPAISPLVIWVSGRLMMVELHVR